MLYEVITGWAVLRELKKDDRLSHIPVIVVTMTDDMGRGFALGAAEFLTKPIDRARLLATLERLRPRDRDATAQHYLALAQNTLEETKDS